MDMEKADDGVDALIPVLEDALQSAMDEAADELGLGDVRVTATVQRVAAGAGSGKGKQQAIKKTRGDLSSAVALQLAAALKRAGRAGAGAGGPAALAGVLRERLAVQGPVQAYGVSADVAPNGFINFFVSQPVAGGAGGSPGPSHAVAMNGGDTPHKCGKRQAEGRGGKGREATRAEESDDDEMKMDEPGGQDGEEEELPVELQGEGGHNFTVQTVPSAFNEEVFELYKKYQVAVHDDRPEDVTR
jgi:hypothetical protein